MMVKLSNEIPLTFTLHLQKQVLVLAGWVGDLLRFMMVVIVVVVASFLVLVGACS